MFSRVCKPLYLQDVYGDYINIERELRVDGGGGYKIKVRMDLL